jgi:hypothetical protein
MKTPKVIEKMNNRDDLPQATPLTDYGRPINALDPIELFAKYEKVGLLCPAERKRLAPYWPQIVEDWRRAMQAGRSLMWFSTWEDTEAGDWGSAGAWRTTHSSWNTQNAVSIDNPLASRAVLLSAAKVRRKHREADRSQQHWFQRNNEFANELFGSIMPALGPGKAVVNDFDYITMPRRLSPSHDDDIFVVPCRDNEYGRQDDLYHLAMGTRGMVYAESEELDHEDLCLDSLDDEYRKVGLRRYRRIWLAYSRARKEAVGAAIAYRGPLGLSFSFLENRCDLILHPMLSAQIESTVALTLLSAIAPVYEDFALGVIPVVTEDDTASRLVEMGGEWIRRYAQAVFLSSGYDGWYRHVERFHERIARADKRYGDGAQHREPVLVPAVA